MAREEISLARLHEILNAELAKYDPCGRCSLPNAPVRLRNPDSHGCNWSRDLKLRGPYASPACAEAAARAIGNVSQRFNLEPEAVK
jgi:hypothetical protein